MSASNKMLTKPIGGYFKNDVQGFIINPCRVNFIAPNILPIIEQIKQTYIKELGNELHSIYLRGSIPRGIFVPTVSDIDMFALIHRPNTRWKSATWTRDLEVQVKRDFGRKISIECMLSTYHTAFFEKNPSLAMVLQTQSICLLGDDISENIPKFRPNHSICINYRWMEEDVATFLQKEEKTGKDFQTIIKVILRTAYEVVIRREKKFTPDLYYCVTSYNNYYPRYADLMWILLACYLNPKSPDEQDIERIRQISVIIVQQIAKEFGGIAQK